MAKESREYVLISRYGITQQDYMIMLEAQKGVCKICSNPPKKGDRRPSFKGELYLDVDHCHSTGKVRGLLCNRCNKGLGQFRDNPEFTAKATLYLKGQL